MSLPKPSKDLPFEVMDYRLIQVLSDNYKDENGEFEKYLADLVRWYAKQMKDAE